jgi:hypothetical protein
LTYHSCILVMCAGRVRRFNYGILPASVFFTPIFVITVMVHIPNMRKQLVA